MRVIVTALCLAMASGGAAMAAPADDAVATAHKFIDAFDAGDMAAARATHEPDASIIDEIPPHQWRSFDAWAGDLVKDLKAAGDTNPKVVLGNTDRAEVDGDMAYVVTEATFSYVEKGKPITEPAHMVFALKREGAGWKISGWAWSGGKPRPAS
jgi:ketosteroid isomerase-like protein